MNIYTLGQTSLVSMLSATDGLFTLAVNNVIPSTTSTQTSSSTQITSNQCFTLYEAISSGSKISGYGGVLTGGNNTAVVEVKPHFFPVATAGAECAAQVTDLGWADSNLTDYEWIALNTQAGIQYFVTGVLNSSQTQANDPFAKSEVVRAACWAAGYAEGLNPFA